MVIFYVKRQKFLHENLKLIILQLLMDDWINLKFKQHYHLKEYVKYNKANSAPLEILEEEKRKLHEIIKDYDLNNIFNCDETGNYKFLQKSLNIILILIYFQNCTRILNL